MRSGELEQVGVELDCCRLVDEIQAQQHGRHAVTMLDPSLQALQWAGLDAHAHAFAKGRRQAHLQVRFQGREDVLQLPVKRLLIEDFKQVRDMLVLTHGMSLPGLQSKEDVPGEKGLLEDDGLAPILMHGIKAGERHRDALSLAMSRKLFLPSRFGMGYEPGQF